jgi:hypothetical protein
MKKLSLLAPLFFIAATAGAQGTLSTQGMGFPPGQLSTQAISMGGAIGEADPLSALNPAALTLLNASIITMQAAPEFRRVTAGSVSQRTSVSRFPLFLGGLKLGQKFTAALSASTLLDRTWSTTVADSQILAVGDTVRELRTQQSDGSLVDVRAALGYMVTPWFRVGLGVHALSGRDFLRSIRTFSDSLRFAPDTQENTLSFGGNAVSLGVQTIWPRKVAIGASYRRGGSLSAYHVDSVVGRGSAPDHYGVSIAYLGINGTTVGVRAAKDSWSRLAGLGSTLKIHEGWDIGVGGDVTGPRFGNSPIALRAGARWRTLPFSIGVDPVKETTFSGGFGLPMAGGRVELNVGALHSDRSAGAGPTESAWTISTGFSVRP